jgi:phytoene dehydrogenase-like protein
MAESVDTYDIAIVGGGHNGLTAAYYLARSGLRVVVLERRRIVGGAAVTEEFHPGFRNSVAAYTVSLLSPRVIRELDLARHGLKVIERPVANFWPVDDAHYLLLPHGLAARQTAIAAFSKSDAARLPAYEAALERAAGFLRDVAERPPPNAGSGWIELFRHADLGGRLTRLSVEDKRVLHDLFTRSAADFLSGWFESDVVKAAFAFDGIVGSYAPPSAPGTAYVLLHHCFGEVNGRTGVWGHAVGGMGAITQAMASAAREVGAEIRTGSAVAEIVVEKKKVAGVRLEDGRVVRARAVAANVAPKLLFRDLVPEGAVDDTVRELFLKRKTGSGTFRMNVALSQLPDFTCLRSQGLSAGPHHGGGIIIGPTLSYLERAYLDARTCGWSREPVIEMLIPSTIDNTLAPEGAHVASLFVQHVAPKLPGGRSWADSCERERFAEVVIDTVTRHAPNFRESIIARQLLSPLDLEREFGLVDGDIFHGQMGLDQIFSARPVLGYADYRMPLDGLYLCGAGAHPGGGVTGLPGRNAAREILRDFRGGPKPLRGITRLLKGDRSENFPPHSDPSQLR